MAQTMQPVVTSSPQSFSVGTTTGDWVYTVGQHWVWVILVLGAMDSGASVEVSIEESADAGTGTLIDGATFTRFYDDVAGTVHTGAIYVTTDRKGYIRPSVVAYDGSVTATVLFVPFRNVDVFDSPEWRV